MGHGNCSIGVFEPAFEFEPSDAYATFSCTNFQASSDGEWKSNEEYLDISTSQTRTQAESMDLDDEEHSRMSIDHEIRCEPMLPTEPSNVEHLDAMVDQEQPEITGKRASYTPLRAWEGKWEEFLLEALRLEGQGDHMNDKCSLCDTGIALYRCTQCSGLGMVCKTCMITAHTHNPLHVIEEWTNATHFEKISLRDIGLVIQLGHSQGEACMNPKRAHKDGFVVIDIYGIHVVELNFCNCHQAKVEYIQILRYGWYPASTERPKTAATNCVLKFFQLLSFESKCSLYEFYNTLTRLSDNTGTKDTKDRYPAWGIIVREWENLKSFKRGGRGHKPGGISGTRPGELAPLCPMCPYPKINMSKGWQRTPQDQQYIHGTYLGIDGNYRLKRRHVSDEEKDPPLGDGLSFYGPYAEYTSYLEKFDKIIKQPTKSTCSNHTAVTAERADPGFAVSGIVSVDCARHDMKRPLGVGDLRKGERFVNTDYMFFNSLKQRQGLKLPRITVSYDISCQWSIKLWERMELYPHSMQIPKSKQQRFQFLVPKFHLPAHRESCQTTYSFNFAHWVGRTDGEAPERGWSTMNAIASSTIEMGPGARRDTLDAHFAYGNWKKSTNIHSLMKRKIEEAAQEAVDYRLLHQHFSSGVPKDVITTWNEQYNAWARDKSKPNPFEKRFANISQGALNKRLLAADKVAVDEGRIQLHEDVSAVQLIITGLRLEEQQRKFSRKAQRDILSSDPSFSVQIRILERDIEDWIVIQHAYIPPLRAIRQKESASSPRTQGKELPVVNIKLHLPSSLLNWNKPIDCDPRLIKIEFELRQAQANDALNDLRDALRLRSYVYIDKDLNQHGQARTTRSRSIIDRIDGKISAAVEKYKAARLALSRLGPVLEKTNWENTFPPLAKEDIRSFKDDDLPFFMKVRLTAKQKKQLLRSTSKKARKQNRRAVSWIWRRPGSHARSPQARTKDPILDEGSRAIAPAVNQALNCHATDLRIEFCKSKARADRWREEVFLLQEEMKRAIAFFRHRQKSWRRLAKKVAPHSPSEEPDAAILEGMRAYAFEQASLFRSMRKKCEEAWSDIPTYSISASGILVATMNEKKESDSPGDK